VNATAAAAADAGVAGAADRPLTLSRFRRPRLIAFGAYFVLALLTAGWYALSDFKNTCACIGNADPATYMWALKWWPFAITHGHNPFVTHYLWAPTGANVAHAALIPAAAIAMWPVTALFGPIASYNVLSILSPTLAAFTTYLLCRRLVRREVPAFVGGLLFGFGAYLFSQLVGHPNLTLVFLIPVAVHLAVRRANRDLSRRAYVGWMAALFVLQVGLSTEILVTALALGVAMLLAARVMAPAPYRSRIAGLFVESLLAGLIAIVVASPFLYYALVNGSFPHGPPGISDALGMDVLNPFFPTRSSWFNHDFQALGLTFEGGNIAEADGYLSLPIIAAFIIWAAGARHRFLGRMVIVAAALSFLFALGSHVHVAGMPTISLPYNWIRNLPLVDYITPSRLIMYTALAMSIGIADWLADPSGRRWPRWLLVGAGIVVLAPNIPSQYWGTPPENPKFFTTAAYRQYFKPGEQVLLFPFGAGGNSMLWQADTNFDFTMPEGYLGNTAPPEFDNQPFLNQLGGSSPPDPVALVQFLKRYHVRHIVLDADEAFALAPTLRALGLKPVQLGGIVLVPIPSL
jgi:hypothetical protein